MKNLITILTILLLIFSSFKRSYPYSWDNDIKESTVEISRRKMTIETTLPGWKVKHNVILKDGLNVGYYVLREGQSFRYEIINY